MRSSSSSIFTSISLVVKEFVSRENLVVENNLLN